MTETRIDELMVDACGGVVKMAPADTRRVPATTLTPPYHRPLLENCMKLSKRHCVHIHFTSKVDEACPSSRPLYACMERATDHTRDATAE